MPLQPASQSDPQDHHVPLEIKKNPDNNEIGKGSSFSSYDGDKERGPTVRTRVV